MSYEDKIKRKALSLLKDLLAEGCEDPVLLHKLLRVGCSNPDPIKQVRDGYDCLIKLKVDSDRAWAVSGMAQLLKDKNDDA